MKCFTLRPQVQIVTSAGTAGMHGVGAVSYTERYPTARPGFPLNDKRILTLAWDAQVPAAEALLRLPDDGRSIKREGRDVMILRASVDTQDGKKVLVPEREDDKDKALVYLAPGSQGGLYLNFEVEDESCVIARGVDDDGRWGRTEELLVALKPFQRVTAVRRTRKWLFWGEVYVLERLSIYFDGRTICYDVDPPRRTGSAW